MLLNLRNAISTEEFDYNFLKYTLGDYKNPRVKINDLLKKGAIIRVKKGLYVFGSELAREPYSKETLANLIYGPSYISLQYALSFYDLIPERIETVTSVTNKRKKKFDTPIGKFSYRYICPSLYSCGLTLHETDARHSFLIAAKEKALADTLYFTGKFADPAQLEHFLFQDQRLDKDDIRTFNLRIVDKLAGLYGHNVNLFYNFLVKLK